MRKGNHPVLGAAIGATPGVIAHRLTSDPGLVMAMGLNPHNSQAIFNALPVNRKVKSILHVLSLAGIGTGAVLGARAGMHKKSDSSKYVSPTPGNIGVPAKDTATATQATGQFRTQVNSLPLAQQKSVNSYVGRFAREAISNPNLINQYAKAAGMNKQAYIEGFIKRCQDANVNPATLSPSKNIFEKDEQNKPTSGKAKKIFQILDSLLDIGPALSHV